MICYSDVEAICHDTLPFLFYVLCVLDVHRQVPARFAGHATPLAADTPGKSVDGVFGAYRAPHPSSPDTVPVYG